MSELSLEDFKKNDLRVAKILEVYEIPAADRLWRLVIEVGSEKKEIVAGIKKFYPKETLIGRNIVVVNNLMPTVIRGIASQGMLLAAKNGEILALVTVDQPIASGSVVG